MKNGQLKVQIDRPQIVERALRPRMATPKHALARNKSDVTRVKMLLRGGSTRGRRSKLSSKMQYRNGRGVDVAAKNSGQRVTIKSRYLKTNTTYGRGASSAHMLYITRDSVGVEGGEAIAFNNEGVLDKNDTKEFIERGADSPHQFRFIVSPENGAELDMEFFAKQFISAIEIDLETKLDYVGVVHYDTDNPHIHFVVNGKTSKGEDLIIDRDYLSSGMRLRASEIVTMELGPRTEQQIQTILNKEITSERYTSLDKRLEDLAEKPNQSPKAKALEKTTNNKIVDMGIIPKNASQRFITDRGNLLGRLNELEGLGLSFEAKPGVWIIDSNLKQKLQALSKETDIIKAIESHINDLSAYRESIALDNETPVAAPITGKVAGKGLVNEMYDTKYMVVEGVDGNVYYTPMALYSEKSGMAAKVGDFVTLDNRPLRTIGGAEHNAVNISKETGVYSINEHRKLIEAGERKLPEGINIDDYIERHRKKMALLESKGFIKPVSQGSWEIPKDLIKTLETAQMEENRKLFVRVDLESTLTLDDQVKARGLTVLDKHIAKTGGKYPVAADSVGFQKDFEDAISKRIETLKGFGLAKPSGETISINKDFVQKLINIENSDMAAQFTQKHGAYKPFDNVNADGLVRKYRGKLTGYTQLPSGKSVIIRGNGDFTIVPMQPGMEKLIGKEIEISINKTNSAQALNKDLQRNRIRFIEISREILKDFGIT